MEDRGATFFELSVSFLLGALIGAGTALLLAPASGEETRKKLAAMGEKAIESSKKIAETGKEKITRVVETAREKTKKTKPEAKKEV